MIPFNNLKIQYERYSNEYENKVHEVLSSGWYVLGKEVEAFEEEFAHYIGCEYCVGLASGLDALKLGIRSLGIGKDDEVIVAANSYIACIMGITENDATPIFVEPDDNYNIDVSQIKKKITKKTKGILAVHLYGTPCDMDALLKICKDYGLYLIEDCSQSHGATWNSKKTGSFGDVSCFSFYPTKGCGGFGDGGCVVTNSFDIRNKVRVLRNYGSEKKYHFSEVGLNSRLDEIQAGLLRIKLKYLEELNQERIENAKLYIKNIHNKNIVLPKELENAKSVWHQFVIQSPTRDKLKQYLSEHNVQSEIHYPIPPHLSEAYSYLMYKRGDFPYTEKLSDSVLSLPLYNGIDKKDIMYITKLISEYKGI